jgi:S-adenosylmethionine hydrolase
MGDDMAAIVLLTDFGMRDPYAAAMKGVIAARAKTPIHDASHEIEPYDVLGAAWFLATIVDYWPPATVFVCVVDPGVGTSRRILAMEKEGRFFLAPDNGLLTFVLAGGVVHSVENRSLFLPGEATTFHGRDRFAPVAAALANGTALAELGPRILDPQLLPYTAPVYSADAIRGSVVGIDRFGNVITDIERSRVPFSPFALQIGGLTIDRLEVAYGDAAPGPFLIVGSSGRIEVSVANASAAERLRIRRLDPVELMPLNV